jgi:hypothetical protein
MVARVVLITIALLLVATPLHTQERFSFFHASTPEMAERMLTLAALRDDDVVMDLGSGDGLIPLTAARMNRRVKGRGVDIDPKLVDQANETARREGLADRVRFEHKNAFDADLRDVTVVTMWVFPELMRLLRPIILERARPGTRVVTSSWDLGTWPADQSDHEGTAVYLWIVPARVAGGWDWSLQTGGRERRYAALIEQHFQKVEGVVRAGDRREILEGMSLRGADIRFTLRITLEGLGVTQHEFNGRVDGDEIAGTVKLTPANAPSETLAWRASRVEPSGYFAPTGTATFQPPADTGFSIP